MNALSCAMKIEWFKARFTDLLERATQTQNASVTVYSNTSEFSLAWQIVHSKINKIKNLPHLVIVDDNSSANLLAQSIRFLNPMQHCVILSEPALSPYEGLSLSSHSVAMKMRFLWQLHTLKPQDIAIIPIGALLSRTLPFAVLQQHTYSLSLGDTVSLPSILNKLGYQSTPMVEQLGQYSLRGGILDFFSPAHEYPIRLEFFGDQIESFRYFDPSSQRSLEEIKSCTVIPAHEVLYLEDKYESTLLSFSTNFKDSLNKEELVRALRNRNYFSGIENLLPLFYDSLATVLDYINSEYILWLHEKDNLQKTSDHYCEQHKTDYTSYKTSSACFSPEKLFCYFEHLDFSFAALKINLRAFQNEDSDAATILFPATTLNELSNLSSKQAFSTEWKTAFNTKLKLWQNDGYAIFVSCSHQTRLEQLKAYLNESGIKFYIAETTDFLWETWNESLVRKDYDLVVLQHTMQESLKLDEEKIIFLKEEDFFGRKIRRTRNDAEQFKSKAKTMSFGDLKPGDLIVHQKHGIGQYDGLKIMQINGAESEFLQLSYKNKDKLYLPVYRISQISKYSSSVASLPLDQLGGHQWEKTKVKVKSSLRDLASELLQLYAKRSEAKRSPFIATAADSQLFANGFPYDETDDQLKTISQIESDMQSDRPMDRLICGDVGFGKTEVAMRAAFICAQSHRQVAVLAPTTVLTFQHFENFKKRFKDWPFKIGLLNRFINTKDTKKYLQELKDGQLDIIIGTHKLLSQTIQFKNLGLLIIDEEQKFGVAHKEKIRKIKNNVDTLTLSATPIPRTLNMSLSGIRDISLINTAPVDRLPVRTMIHSFDLDVIKKAVVAEVKRGGQVYFVHNRIQSIYALADELRQLMPDIRMHVGHGQMVENDLEKIMVDFFEHKIDLLLSTAIIESGMDVSKANTIIIDNAHTFGLSQLYQLRGRVGRSKERAYCYLLIPKNLKLEKDQQERLRIIQENSALGSGIKIAQYDLELRGSGELLGENQSGHANSVGYELYMDLLQEALLQAKGLPSGDIDLDPEINLKIPALIPDSYISDIRLRLSYYKALSDVQTSDDLAKIEEELKDQFGALPEATINLMGLMLIRSLCKKLGIRDVSAGLKSISLVFTEQTPLKPEMAIQLALRENKKYSLTPDLRMNIRMNNITWIQVQQELDYLLSTISSNSSVLPK